MKIFVFIIFLGLIISCSEKKQNSENVNNISEATTIGLMFINDYTKYQNDQINNKGLNSDSNWVHNNIYSTNNFKEKYKQILLSALQEDPELGLESDPIFDAQDFPDQGFKLTSFDSTTGYLVVSDIENDSFQVVLKMAKENNKWLVDGCGTINVPEQYRAKR